MWLRCVLPLAIACWLLGPKGFLEQRFLLARHGQTTFNEEKRFQGCLNEQSLLTSRGKREAETLGKWLRGLLFIQVYIIHI